MFSEIKWRFTAAVAAGLILIAVHAFQWAIVDRISPFFYFPLLSVVWWVALGTGLASLTCFTKVRTIGVRAFAPASVIVLSVLIAKFAPFTSLWLDFEYWLYTEERLEIVQRIANGELEPNVEYNSKLVGLGDTYPPVSTGGNEIVVEEHDGKKYVLFFTYRGVLDNYSGFLYVPNGGSPSLFSDLDEQEFTQIELLEENWYFVSHR